MQPFTRLQESLAGCHPRNRRRALSLLHGNTRKAISIITQVFFIRRDGAIQFLSNCERAEPTGPEDKKNPAQNTSKITFLHQGLNAILEAKEKC